MKKINPTPELNSIEMATLAALYGINTNMQKINGFLAHNVGMTSKFSDLVDILSFTNDFIESLNLLCDDDEKEKDMGCHLADS